MGLLAGDKFSPTLFVGLGGAGSRVVNLLAGKLKRHPHWDRLADLVHFVVVDTNKDDLYKNDQVPPDCRFLISAFDRRAYVRRKRGMAELPEDTMLTQWVHPDYDFRDTRGAGAGQIRVESRLGMFYSLEDDRAGIRRKLTQLLDRATRRENPWRDNDDRVIHVLLYASVAGGTGSGGFLPMAYLLKDLVRDQGWGRPNLVATLSMPSTFLDRVERQLHDDIRANGYAALKELEFLTKIGYADHPSEYEFHYDPDARARTRVDERPFSLVYVVDKPAELSIERYEHAVADAAFLQVFSPLLGAQTGEYDNYDKHQKSLALGHFAVHYGTYGTALLQLPRRDVLHYASLRYAAHALGSFLVFGADDPRFRVPYGDPKFERLDQREKDRIADDKYVAWVAWRAGLEVQVDELGLFTAIHGQTNRHGTAYASAFQQRLQQIFDHLDELIDLAPVNPGDITTGNPSLSRQLDGLRRDTAASRGRVMGEYLQASLTDLKTDRFFTSFFKDQEVNPLAQRLFLIHQVRREFIGPMVDPEEDAWLREEGGSLSDLDSEGVIQEVKEATERLQRTAEQGFFGRMLSSENKDFARAKRRAVQLFDRLAQDQRDALKRTFWQTLAAELRQSIEARLSAFRKVAEIANEQARLAADAAERFRRDPATQPGSDVGRYYLDTEVLRDDRRRERMWDVLYLHLLDKSAYFDQEAIFSIITEAFSPRQDPDGRLRPRDAGEIVRYVRDQLEAQGLGTYSQALDDAGFDLQSALELEARYLALRDQGADLVALRQQAGLDDAIRAVATDEVRRRILDKLERTVEECVVLAHLDRTRMDDPTVVPARIFYAGLAPSYDTDEPTSLGRLLREVASGVDFVEGWNEPDALVLYRAMLGVPVYFFKRVNDELHHAYLKVRSDPHRSYPLHIDRGFEGEALPDLEPVSLRRARERAEAEDAARREREARTDRTRHLVRGLTAGVVVERDGAYHWEMRGYGKPLGERFSAAWDGFGQLDPTLRGDLTAAADAWWQERSLDRAGREQLTAAVAAVEDKLTGRFYQAAAEGWDAERRALEEARDVARALREGLSTP